MNFVVGHDEDSLSGQTAPSRRHAAIRVAGPSASGRAALRIAAVDTIGVSICTGKESAAVSSSVSEPWVITTPSAPLAAFVAASAITARLPRKGGPDDVPQYN